MTAERGTPEWWRDRLLDRYKDDVEDRELNAAYYDSINPSPEMLENVGSVYRRLLGLSKTPWGRLVVDITAERLSVNGFRVGGTEVDEQLWVDFRKSRMEALQRQIHREALALGTSYASVWDGNISFESALSVTHENAAGDPHQVAAAVKVWYDSVEGRLRCTLYLPDSVHRWRSHSEVNDDTFSRSAHSIWKTTSWDYLQEDGVIPNPYNQVPIVPFVVRPNWEGYGVSDLEDLRPLIGRIESITANTVLAVELGAFRQKWATGLEIPTDPDTGESVEPFKAALDRLWTSEDEATRFGSFDATDIRPYLQAVSDAIGQLSAVSRVPTLYFNQSELSNPPSAASLEATETGLIKKVMERMDRFSESWEQVAAMVLNDSDSPITVSWNDPRTRSEAQMVDAASKLYNIGFPFEAILEYMGYTPEEVKRLKRMRATDTFDRLLNSPLPTATRINAPTQEQPVQAEGE